MIDEPDAHLDQQIASHILRWAALRTCPVPCPGVPGNGLAAFG
jgi:hypothetical protein